MRRAWAVLRQRCPRCYEGAVFGGLLAMREECPACGLRFGREPGYFTGAMYISYTLGLFAAIPVMVVLLVIATPVWLVIAAPAALLLVLAPLTFRYSRVIWMHLDRGFDPEPPGRGAAG
jgi:uncharacterized protein (DUF983 family)